MIHRARSFVVIVLAASAALLMAVVTPVGADPSGAPAPSTSGGELTLESVSNQPELVSGGQVLVRVLVPRTVPLHQVRVHVGDRDVTDAFAVEDAGARQLIGLVDGLAVGDNVLVAEANGQGLGRPRTSLVVTNHPTEGPVFSGPHITPFYCETEPSGLGPADDDCHVEGTDLSWFYRPATSGAFVALDDPDAVPDDVATTTTTDGATVPFVIRVESGTINRSIYRIAVLADPTDPRRAASPGGGWNERLQYQFGGGCGTDYRQGTLPIQDVLAMPQLADGYAFATASLNVGSVNCNDIVSAETAMMVKEHFIERYGEPLYTMGRGGSGGAIQQHLIAQNYPGILDGITPTASFPDALTLGMGVTDCRLLTEYFATTSQGWTMAQQTEVSGFATWRTCLLWNRFGAQDNIVPDICRGPIPPEDVYDADANPDGARCTYEDFVRNVFGTDPATGHAPTTLDSVGVQYGLEALNEGVIDVEQFLDLNERVGGFDRDGNIVPTRSTASESGVASAYRTGRVLTGGGGLGQTPIIDSRAYRDPSGNPHDSFRSFSVRQRLVEANGHADNHVIWTNPQGVSVVDVMDEWLTAIKLDTSDLSLADKVAAHRPADARDSCWAGGQRVIERRAPDSGLCSELFPVHGDPRTASGASVATDTLACSRVPVDEFEHYEATFTDSQRERLRSIFPTGVCAYELPGIGEATLDGTWQDHS